MTAPTRPRRSTRSTAPTRATEGRVKETRKPPEALGTPGAPPARRQPPVKNRMTAAERAYARRAHRVDALQRNAEPQPQLAEQPVKSRLKLRWPTSRASFVLIMMSLLAAGVASTLWLSTQAIADSYRLEQVKQENSVLSERAEQLQREVAKEESVSALAQKAKDLGMVPGGDPARIVVNPDGTTSLVGQPKKAVAPPPPPPPVVVAPPTTPAAPPTPTAPIEGDVPANPDQPNAQAPVVQQPATLTPTPEPTQAPPATQEAPATPAPQGPVLGGGQ